MQEIVRLALEMKMWYIENTNGKPEHGLPGDNLAVILNSRHYSW